MWGKAYRKQLYAENGCHPRWSFKFLSAVHTSWGQFNMIIAAWSAASPMIGTTLCCLIHVGETKPWILEQKKNLWIARASRNPRIQKQGGSLSTPTSGNYLDTNKDFSRLAQGQSHRSLEKTWLLWSKSLTFDQYLPYLPATWTEVEMMWGWGALPVVYASKKVHPDSESEFVQPPRGN